MSVTEADRRDLFVRLERTIGRKAADNLMKLLPPIPSDQIVTRTDHLAQTARMQGEMAELRAELRGEMVELRAELRGEMAELRGEVRSEIAGLQKWAAGILAANGVALIAALFV